jgi:hypothetical protein
MARLRHLREIRGSYCARLSLERRTPMPMRYRLRLHAWLMSTLPGALAPLAAIQGGIASAAEPHPGSLTGAVPSL